MLYVIDNDILDKIEDKELTEQDLGKLNSLFNSLKEIVDSKFNGIFVADDDFQNRYVRLRQTDFIHNNVAAYNVLQYIFEVYQELYNMVQQLSVKTLITWRTNNLIQIPNEIDLCETIQIDIDTFINVSKHLNFDDAVSLAVENPTDFQLYESFLNNFCPSFGFNLEYYRLNMVNGGGSTIGNTMEGEVRNNKRLTVALIDSDKSLSGEKLGSTAEGALRTSRKLNRSYSSAVTRVYLLEVKEKENLFSPSEYSLAFQSGSSEEKNTLKYLKIIENEINKEESQELKSFLNKFDYKKGITKIDDLSKVKEHQKICDIARRHELSPNSLSGLGKDPVINFFPVEGSKHHDYYKGEFNLKIIDTKSFVHEYRLQIACFVYSLGFRIPRAMIL